MTTGRTFLANIFLALVWATTTEQFTLGNLVIGFGLGYVVLALSQYAMGHSTYFTKSRRIITFILFIIWEITLANLRVAYAVIMPSQQIRPAIIGIPLDEKIIDIEIVALATVVSLTPGTLSLDVSPDRDMLYVHTMFIGERDQFERRLKQEFERRLLEIF
jgi:multicomponent Na+:H+ antiporter subunit E